MLFTDTHCHLYFSNFQKDLPAVLERAQNAGVGRILVPAIDPQTCHDVIRLVEVYEFVYGALGVHQ